MKKSYVKPKVFCINYQTGQVSANDSAYAEYMKKKTAAFMEKEGTLAPDEDGEVK